MDVSIDKLEAEKKPTVGGGCVSVHDKVLPFYLMLEIFHNKMVGKMFMC